MAQDEAPQGIPDPYPSAEEMMAQATAAGKLVEAMRADPSQAPAGVGVAGMRTMPDPEPEPLSKSIQGPIELSHVMDAIGRTEEQNRQIIDLLKNQALGRF